MTEPAPRADVEIPDTPLAKGMRTLFLAAGLTSSLVPNLDFFRALSPPLFADTSLITSGLAIVLLYFGWTHEVRRPVQVALFAALIGIALIVIYQLAFAHLTVSPPEGRVGSARQIGFHLARWSLTARAQTLVDDNRDDFEVDTPEMLMLTMGGWEDGKIATIWKPWTIIAAGILLIVLFGSGFACWTYAFGVLARFVAAGGGSHAQLAMPEAQRAPARAPDPAPDPLPPKMPAPVDGVRARIVRLLPRPAADPRRKESATIKNLTSTPLDLTGWWLGNGQGKRWKLDELGVLAPGAECTVFRNGQAMSLRDAGDTIQLRDEQGTLQHELRYERVAVDEEVRPRE